MSDEAVKAKTGKTWKEWFALLDKAGARKLTHKEIARLLSEKFGVGPWWCQSVTVAYEQQTGRRVTHEKTDGFQISVSRTIDVPLTKLYRAFSTEEARNAWLRENGLVVRKATPNKSMRVTWIDQKSSLEVNFYEKGASKSQVVVQHSKLPNSRTAVKMKTYWTMALGRLRHSLGG